MRHFRLPKVPSRGSVLHGKLHAYQFSLVRGLDSPVNLGIAAPLRATGHDRQHYDSNWYPSGTRSSTTSSGAETTIGVAAVAGCEVGRGVSRPDGIRWSVECIASVERARSVAQDLLAAVPSRESLGTSTSIMDADAAAIAVDCEGVRLGRFGRVCLVQMALSDGRAFVFDALKPG